MARFARIEQLEGSAETPLPSSAELHPPLHRTIPLRYRKIVKKNIRSILLLCVGWCLISFALAAFSGTSWLAPRLGLAPRTIWLGWSAVLVLALSWRCAYQLLYFLTYFYDMDDNNFIVRKGVIAKREITIPFNKVTDVYVDQDMLDVMLGLYNVHISTPTVESGQFAHIDGLNRRGAVELRRLVLNRINIS